MLCPNSAPILHSLGAYESLKNDSYQLEAVTYKNAAGLTTDKFYFGNKNKYGFKALRAHRHLVLENLRQLAEEKGVNVLYGRKFEKVISESKVEGVRFSFADGSEATASLLIGADGIHSKVRSSVFPNAPIPQYSGQTAFVGTTTLSNLRIPSKDFKDSFPMVMFGTGSNGACLLFNFSKDGETIAVATHRPWPEQDREGWDALAKDRKRIIKMIEGEKSGAWPDVVESAIESLTEDTTSIWPYYQLPRLEKWVSEKGRVLLLGDAAHAIPPSGGQGANQAFEDAWTLAQMLGNLSEKISLEKGLEIWEDVRQERVRKVTELTLLLGNVRLPLEERERLDKGKVWSAEDVNIDWLYMGRSDLEILERMKAKEASV
jgi:2-polyprenyl-6-methoxyphenol hydroxylase-like FAD-dependent oxidoreductase